MGLFKTKDSTPKKAKQNKKQKNDFQSLEKEMGIGYPSGNQGYNQSGFAGNIPNSYQQNQQSVGNQYGSIPQYQQNYQINPNFGNQQQTYDNFQANQGSGFYEQTIEQQPINGYHQPNQLGYDVSGYNAGTQSDFVHQGSNSYSEFEQQNDPFQNKGIYNQQIIPQADVNVDLGRGFEDFPTVGNSQQFSQNNQQPSFEQFQESYNQPIDPRLQGFVNKAEPIPAENLNSFTNQGGYAKEDLPTSFSLKTADYEFQEEFNPRQESFKEAIAPSAFKRGEIDHLIVGSKYARVFCIEGLPDQVYIGYLRVLYSSDYDVDINLSIQPRQQSSARKELQDKVTVLRAQLEEEIERGGNRNRDIYVTQIEKLESQIRELSSREESAFEAQFLFTLYADSREELSRHTINILQELKEERITAQVLALRQDEGYRTVAPYAIDYLKDKKRNFNTGATISSIPFYVPELYDEFGVYLGVNTYSGTPALIDLYADGINNSNLNVFGASGSGKSTLVKILTARSTLHGIRTVIIDPEGEYSAMTNRLHGGVVRLSTSQENSIMMNIFDIEESVEINPKTNEQVKTLELRPKYVDILGFIKVIYPEIDKGQEANLLEVIERLYFNFGFIDGDVDSLYYNDDVIVENGRLVNNLRKKRMPTLNDLINLTHTMVEDGTYPNLREVFEALQPYRARKTLGIFDTQTPKELQRIADLPIITFDISGIESSDIKTLSMYVLLSWIWEKFGKKNPHIKKRVLVDEAWMMMSPSQPGYEHTSKFLETMSRRIRKRNGGLCVASQKIDDFNQTAQGRAVLSNAHTTFLLNHEEIELPALRKAFDLDEGIIQNIINVERGRVLIKQSNKLYLCNTQIFENEKRFVFTGPQALRT
ncbi:MAG: ATP-binding protein [Parvimonas micra]|uniref:ATP-binding protein n=1 Tax=Parvimonas micra TaxID=33033 RepID=A0A930E1Q0_9FIRM|nr:DUF87 domain-containing protein [Parvimonas micra]MBF1306197.1 ATP-binding protein [Parvimonas micra]